MTAPGVINEVIDQPPPSSVPTAADLRRAFVASPTIKGAAGAALGPFHSLGEVVAACGDRSGAFMLTYDWMDTFFHEGGSEVYLSRVAGPGLVAATHTFNDGSAAASLIVSADSPGAWGNNVTVAILTNSDDATIPSGQIEVQVTYNGTVVEKSGPIATQADAVTWSHGSDYVSIAIGAASDLPAHNTGAALTGGNDDSAGINDTQWANAYPAFVSDLGPGQVVAPGRTTDVGRQQLAAHADAYNRVAFCDLADTATKATLKTAVAAIRSQVGDRVAGCFAPWIKVPGIVPGTERVVPPSALVAGATSRLAGLGVSPAQAPAGSSGRAIWATGVSQPAWSDADRDELNQAGVNVIRVRNGIPTVYGFRSAADPNNAVSKAWLQLNWGRLAMAMKSIGDAVLEEHSFADIDGQGHLFSAINAELIGAYMPFFEDGSLYGATIADAVQVDMGAQVNPPTDLADGQLKALVKARMSPAAEVLVLQLAKYPITQEIS